MERTIDERIERLLDQLENPGLTDGEINRIEKKILVLVAQKNR